MSATYDCICCGRDVAAHQYRPGLKICALCAAMSPNDVAIMTLNTANKRAAYLTSTRAGRRESRITAKLEAYAVKGKRCSACQHHKLPAEFGACSTRPDGLQANCKTCNKIRLAIVQNGGSITQWHNLRDSMRASANGPLDGQPEAT